MEQVVEDFLDIDEKISNLKQQIIDLTAQQESYKNRVLDHLNLLNKEKAIIGDFTVKLKYFRKYDYDIEVLSKILSPFKETEKIFKISINNSNLIRFLSQENVLDNADYEKVVNAIHIKSVYEKLLVS